MMTIINPWEIKRRSEAGIALVVVLGLLALMTLVATAFVYFMRTENTAAHYYRLDVSSKHVLNVALSRALMDLNYDLRTDVYPRWSGQYNVLMSARDTNDPPLGSSEREFAAAMSSPRFLTSLTPVAKSKTPAAKSALYSPRLCPAAKVGSAPDFCR